MTETQQEVLEIITAMANRETQENLCRSEETQIYMTEQRRTERTVPLGSPKSKQSDEFDANKKQPNLPDFDILPPEIKEKNWGNISYQSLTIFMMKLFILERRFSTFRREEWERCLSTN